MELTDEERYNIEQKTYDCKPTLTDKQVLEFCKQGFLLLEGVVPDEINRKTLEYLEKKHLLRTDRNPQRRLVR